MKQIKQAIDIVKEVAIYGVNVGRRENRQLREVVKLLEQYLYLNYQIQEVIDEQTKWTPDKWNTK